MINVSNNLCKNNARDKFTWIYVYECVDISVYAYVQQVTQYRDWSRLKCAEPTMLTKQRTKY